MKKILSLLTVICLLVFCSTTVFAASDEDSTEDSSKSAVTLKVGSAEAAPGGTVAVKLSIAENPGIAALEIKVGFDKSAMSLKSIEDLELIKGSYNGNENNGYLCWVSLEETNKIGDLAILTFDISENAASKSYPIKVSVLDCYTRKCCQRRHHSKG